MFNENGKIIKCPICNEEKKTAELVKGSTLKSSLIETIRHEHPDWSSDEYICLNDLTHYRKEHIDEILEIERGTLSNLEIEVAKSLKDEELLSKNTDKQFDSSSTFGERIADKVALFGGSWKFIIMFGAIIFIWITINATFIILKRPFDPFPFILLNLLLSCLAALQAPVIMMSQNRQEDKDRLRAEHDYQINLKAELEIRHLNEKIDFITHQWVKLMETQEMQIEIMEELLNREKK